MPRTQLLLEQAQVPLQLITGGAQLAGRCGLGADAAALLASLLHVLRVGVALALVGPLVALVMEVLAVKVGLHSGRLFCDLLVQVKSLLTDVIQLLAGWAVAQVIVAQARIHSRHGLDGQQVPVVLRHLVLVGQAARPGRGVEHASSPPGVLQIPWGALGDIKPIVPVLVKCPAANLEVQAVMHQLGDPMRLILRVDHGVGVPLVPYISFGCPICIAIHFTDPWLVPRVDGIHVTRVLVCHFVSPDILCVFQPECRHALQIIPVDKEEATNLISASA
mmetsp:Transcript_34414/g.76451  ORF Transcript_34414/g.76451 Transcript_34414/m.76451 type:complete len:277 (-) Transcript_34414:808-1638(-)